MVDRRKVFKQSPSVFVCVQITWSWLTTLNLHFYDFRMSAITMEQEVNRPTLLLSEEMEICAWWVEDILISKKYQTKIRNLESRNTFCIGVLVRITVKMAEIEDIYHFSCFRLSRVACCSNVVSCMRSVL